MGFKQQDWSGVLPSSSAGLHHLCQPVCTENRIELYTRNVAKSIPTTAIVLFLLCFIFLNAAGPDLHLFCLSVDQSLDAQHSKADGDTQVENSQDDQSHIQARQQTLTCTRNEEERSQPHS